MVYPQAPWTLKGYAVVTAHLLDIDTVRPFIPKELEIVSVWPGKTVGSVYLSYYGPGSELEYSELIVAPAIVRYADKFGAWVSHIYVDNPDSVAGGREIWGLPKELASFSWEKGSRDRYSCTVNRNDTLLCRLNYSQPSWKLNLPLSGFSFGACNTDLLYFKAELESQVGLVSGKLEIPNQSDFAQLRLGQPFLTVYSDERPLKVNDPRVIGQIAVFRHEELVA